MFSIGPFRALARPRSLPRGRAHPLARAARGIVFAAVIVISLRHNGRPRRAPGRPFGAGLDALCGLNLF